MAWKERSRLCRPPSPSTLGLLPQGPGVTPDSLMAFANLGVMFSTSLALYCELNFPGLQEKHSLLPCFQNSQAWTPSPKHPASHCANMASRGEATPLPGTKCLVNLCPLSSWL